MTRLPIVLLPLVLLLAACGKEPPPLRPVVEGFLENLRGQDYGAVYDLLATEEKADREREAERMRADIDRRGEDPKLATKLDRIAEAFGVTIEQLKDLPSRELFVRGARAKAGARLAAMAAAEIQEEPLVEGKRGTVRLRLTSRREVVTVVFILEENEWRLVLPT